jgi:DNA-binding CsgD family transcriptional regulator
MSHDVLFDLLKAQSIADLHPIANRIAGQLDFAQFVYRNRLTAGLGSEPDLVISNYPVAWGQTYRRENRMAIDPNVAHCMSSSLPWVWSESSCQKGDSSALKESARQLGLRSGLTIPLYSRHGPGLLSLAGTRAEPMIRENVELLGQAQLFAIYLHEAAARLIERKQPIQHPRCKLTSRERECLSWVAEGKSSWEISRIISCSERTVNFHVGNVIQKLNVANRSQAAAKALAVGLIGL